MKKILIAYFSRADENWFGGEIRSVEKGNTEIVCGILERLIPADLFRIEMKHPYSAVYMECVRQAAEDKKSDARPELAAYPGPLDAYDTVILAYPNYCGTIPMAMFTFLESADFTEKKILPLCTNEGSGMGSSEKDIRRLCPGAEIMEGLPVNGSRAAESEPDLRAWLGRNGLIG